MPIFSGTPAHSLKNRVLGAPLNNLKCKHESKHTACLLLLLTPSLGPWDLVLLIFTWFSRNRNMDGKHMKKMFCVLAYFDLQQQTDFENNRFHFETIQIQISDHVDTDQ